MKSLPKVYETLIRDKFHKIMINFGHYSVAIIQ
jgi:hypothetical protein